MRRFTQYHFFYLPSVAFSPAQLYGEVAVDSSRLAVTEADSVSEMCTQQKSEGVYLVGNPRVTISEQHKRIEFNNLCFFLFYINHSFRLTDRYNKTQIQEH